MQCKFSVCGTSSPATVAATWHHFVKVRGCQGGGIVMVFVAVFVMFGVTAVLGGIAAYGGF
jgi:hypothetical protein